MRKRKIILSMTIAGALLCGGCQTAKQGESKKNTDKPVEITVWHYYNGAQQKSFNSLVKTFNETKGKEAGIEVKASGLGTVSDLESNVLDAINGQVGAKEVPNIFAAYADTAYMIDQKEMAVDLSKYLTEDEIAEYMDSYIEEGRFSSEDSLKIFPVAKATEVFMLNKTDWDKFAEATGTDTEAFMTIEGLTETAEKYYEWTDSLTEEPDDGKALFGRDAFANFFIIGAKQLGTEIFSLKDGEPVLDFDKEVVRKIWDNYYVPYINGYFDASGKFRSDDIKTGNLISFVGSSAGATFFPDSVTLSDTDTYPIEMEVYECPQFQGGEKYAVQQGAGMVVLKADDEEVKASVEFLKWFTEEERNIEFSVESGYLPVKKSANNEEAIEKFTDKESSDKVKQIIKTSLQMVNGNTLYTTKAFEKGTDARNILEYSLPDKAAEDREQIKALIQSGMTRQEAVSQYDTDENFEEWYTQTKAELEKLIEESK